MTYLFFFLTYRREVLVWTREEDENMTRRHGEQEMSDKERWVETLIIRNRQVRGQTGNVNQRRGLNDFSSGV